MSKRLRRASGRFKAIFSGSNAADGPKKGSSLAQEVTDYDSIELPDLSEEELALVVRMQARIRGNVVRKSVASRGNEKQRTFYYKALQNLHDLEVQYVAGLGVLVETYLHPLLIPKNKKTLKIKERDIRVLFRNIEELHKRHCVFMFQLHSHMTKFPANERTGSLLVKEIPDMVALYDEFARNAFLAEDVCNRWSLGETPTLKPFLEFVARKRAEGKGPQVQVTGMNHIPPVARELHFLLEEPFEHLGRLQEKVKQLVVFSTRENSDYENLLEANALLSATHLHIANVRKREKRNFILETLYESLVTDTIRREELMLLKGTRELLCDGKLEVDGKSKHVFLLTDMMIITRKQTNTFRIAAWMSLGGATIAHDTYRKDKDKRVFKITSYKDHTLTLSYPVSSPIDWLKCFDDAVSQVNEDVFGRPLSTLVDPDDMQNVARACPLVIAATVSHLTQHVNLPGLFRRPPTLTSIKSLRKRLNQQRKFVDISLSDPHDVAHVLLDYLKELPVPVIDYDTCSAAILDSKSKQRMKQMLMQMDSISRTVLEHVLFLLSSICASADAEASVESVDRPSSIPRFCLRPDELASVFAPALIRSAKGDLAYIANFPAALNTTRRLIKNVHALFSEIDDAGVPTSVEELLVSGDSHQWWKDFRAKKPDFVAFLQGKETLVALINASSAPQPKLSANDPDAEEMPLWHRKSSMALLLCTSPECLDAILQHDEVMEAVLCKTVPSPADNVHTKNACRIAAALFKFPRSTPIVELITERVDLLDMMIAHLYSSDVFQLFCDVLQHSYRNSALLPIFVSVGNRLLDDLQRDPTPPEVKDGYPQAAADFVCEILRDMTFRESEEAESFLARTLEKTVVDELIQRAFNPSTEVPGSRALSVAVCTLLVELLQRPVSIDKEAHGVTAAVEEFIRTPRNVSLPVRKPEECAQGTGERSPEISSSQEFEMSDTGDGGEADTAEEEGEEQTPPAFVEGEGVRTQIRPRSRTTGAEFEAPGYKKAPMPRSLMALSLDLSRSSFLSREVSLVTLLQPHIPMLENVFAAEAGERFGEFRLQVLRVAQHFIIQLLIDSGPTTQNVLKHVVKNTKLFDVLWESIFQFPACSILHAAVEDVLAGCMLIKYVQRPMVCDALFERLQLPHRILQAFKEARNDQGLHSALLGYLLLIAQSIEKCPVNSEFFAVHTTLRQEWEQIVLPAVEAALPKVKPASKDS